MASLTIPWDPWISSLFFTLLICFPSPELAHSPQKFALPNLRSLNQHFTARRKLHTLNKPAVKTIQSSDGDTIDCVLLQHQPALDHPKLKGHQIKAYPTARPHSSSQNATSGGREIRQIWKESGDCPEGTIPIRRTSLDDIQRAPSVESFGRKSSVQVSRFQKPVRRDQSWAGGGHDHAIAYVSGGEYYGSAATINVWDPWIESPSDFSLSQMWILAGSFGNDLNTIEAGWQVSPELYGDGRPRFFIYWTADAYQQTGCYNLLCAGFVQTSNQISMGAAIAPWSTYGKAQYDIRILIWKDPTKGDWWMEFGNGALVGYWPAALFTHLGHTATVVEWGGEVAQTMATTRHTATHMGSGRFAQDGFTHASYFRNVQVVNSKNQLDIISTLATSADHPSCYNIRPFYSSNWGNFFYYGGPGRNPNCP